MSESESKPAGKSALVRQIVLFILLAVALGALYYDNAIARPAAEQAYDLIIEKADERAKTPEKPFSPAEIHEILGKQPADVITSENFTLERFSWIRGLPWKTYDLTVAYLGKGEEPRFHSHYGLGEEVPDYMLPGYTRPAPSTELPPDPIGAGAGAGGPTPPPFREGGEEAKSEGGEEAKPEGGEQAKSEGGDEAKSEGGEQASPEPPAAEPPTADPPQPAAGGGQ